MSIYVTVGNCTTAVESAINQIASLEKRILDLGASRKKMDSFQEAHDLSLATSIG